MRGMSDSPQVVYTVEGNVMIAAAKVQEVERLLAENRWSQRMVAKMSGVSRAVVGAIAAGKRPDYEARRLARDDEDHTPTGPVGRCGDCGAKVYLPFRLCKIRALKAEQREKARAELGMTAAVERRRLRVPGHPPDRRDNPGAPPEQRRAG